MDSRSGYSLANFGPSFMKTSLIDRRVDLNTKGFLSPYFVAEVLKEAQAQYVAA